MSKRFIVRLVLAVTTLLGTATAGVADPSLGNVSPHRHWIITTSRRVEVGPRVCDNPNLQEAFNQFHSNVHRVTGTSIGPAAPGLHNFKGGEIGVSGC